MLHYSGTVFCCKYRQNGQRRTNPCPVDREELVYEKVRNIKYVFSQ